MLSYKYDIIKLISKKKTKGGSISHIPPVNTLLQEGLSPNQSYRDMRTVDGVQHPTGCNLRYRTVGRQPSFVVMHGRISNIGHSSSASLPICDDANVLRNRKTRTSNISIL